MTASGFLKEEENTGQIFSAMSFICYNYADHVIGNYMTGHVARMDRNEECMNILVGNSEGKRVPLQIQI
jgi:hypothetical protein